MMQLLLVVVASVTMAGWSGRAIAQDAAPGIKQKAVFCAGCHGANGVPINTAFPVIAGQQAGYLYFQLRDYKLGNRRNALMQAVVAKLEKQDLHDLAEYFATQPWPELRQPAPPPEVTHRAEAAASSAVCTSCHLEDYVGSSTIPKLAGQPVDYLRATMAAFRSGERANNPWMAALLKTYSDADLDAMAKYLAAL